MSPFLSVVIPTYNRKESLKVTLDALGRQTPLSGQAGQAMPSFEVVVISDGSTDGTDAFLTEYAACASYPLRWIQQENGGPAKARNRGVHEATGEVIVFIDDDVEPAPPCLAVHASHHEKDDKIAVIGPMSPDPARRKEEPVWIAWEHEMLQRQYKSLVALEWGGVGPPHYYTGNASQRREHVLAVGGFNEKFQRMEDIELAVRMAKEVGVRFAFDPKAAALHRPMRSFTSWLKVPYAYGGRMVARAKTGEESWRVVASAWTRRNRLTQAIALYVLPRPNLSAPTERILQSLAVRLYSLPGATLRYGGLLALSALYNIRLLEGARDELGSWPELQQRIREASSPKGPTARPEAAR